MNLKSYLDEYDKSIDRRAMLCMTQNLVEQEYRKYLVDEMHSELYVRINKDNYSTAEEALNNHYSASLERFDSEVVSPERKSIDQQFSESAKSFVADEKFKKKCLKKVRKKSRKMCKAKNLRDERRSVLDDLMQCRIRLEAQSQQHGSSRNQQSDFDEVCNRKSIQGKRNMLERDISVLTHQNQMLESDLQEFEREIKDMEGSIQNLSRLEDEPVETTGEEYKSNEMVKSKGHRRMRTSFCSSMDKTNTSDNTGKMRNYSRYHTERSIDKKMGTRGSGDDSRSNNEDNQREISINSSYMEDLSRITDKNVGLGEVQEIEEVEEPVGETEFFTRILEVDEEYNSGSNCNTGRTHEPEVSVPVGRAKFAQILSNSNWFWDL